MKVVESKTFQLIAGDAALDLVNTLDWRFRETGADELLVSYNDLLSFSEQARLLSPLAARALRESTPRAGARALRAARNLRELCAMAFYAFLDGKAPDSEAAAGLERHFKAAHASQRLGIQKSRLGWSFEDMRDADLPVWLLAIRAESLLTSSDEMGLVRACDAPSCRWLFLDSSKNHSRRWCDMKVCGNRVKARRFKAVHGS